jgi:hypothetical protein
MLSTFGKTDRYRTSTRGHTRGPSPTPFPSKCLTTAELRLLAAGAAIGSSHKADAPQTNEAINGSGCRQRAARKLIP